VRAYLPGHKSKDLPQCHIFQLDVEQALYDDIAAVDQAKHLHLGTATQQQMQRATTADPVLQSLATTILTGWPDTKEEVPVNIREYWPFRDEMTVQDGVVYKGMKVVVPRMMRQQMIIKSHRSHLGQEACIRRARDVLYWPGMVGELKQAVEQCTVCSELADKQPQEPMLSHKIPSLPWTKVGQDLCTVNNRNYLVTVDFYSDYFEVDDLGNDTTAESVVKATKSHFGRNGIPSTVMTDNGPQYTSSEFQTFKTNWEFEHVTSSPYHSRSNGKAESAVKIAKKLIKKSKRDETDFEMALLEWRNTPDSVGSSPMQKLQSRRSRTTIPTAEALLKPSVPEGVSEQIHLKRQKAKLQYDKHAKPLPELEIGEKVRLQPVKPKQPWAQGACVAKVGPRSYLVETGNGQLIRRNRKFLRTDKSTSEAPSAPMVPPEPNTDNKQAPAPTPAKPATPAMPATPRMTMDDNASSTPMSQPYVTRTGRMVKARKLMDI